MKQLILRLIGIIPLALLLITLSCQQKGEEVMTEEQAKAIMDRYMVIWNEGDMTGIEDLIYPDFVMHDISYPEDVVGLEAFKEYLNSFRTSFPDFSVIIHEMIVKDNNIVTRWTATGTHTGPLPWNEGEIPSTGKKFSVPGACVTKVVQGKIKEDFMYYSYLAMLEQLGFTMIPPAE